MRQSPVLPCPGCCSVVCLHTFEMPSFSLKTNVPKAKVTEAFLKEASKTLSTTLGKPEGYCTVGVTADLPMVFGGTTDPCGTAELMSIGKLGVAENKKHAAAIYPVVEKHLGIPGDRLYVTFVDANPSEVGYQGSTFHDILGGK